MSTQGKLFKDLTEEEIIQDALEVLPEYRERIRSTGDFDLDRCVRMALARIERLYKSKHGIYSHMQMDRREREEMIPVLAHFQPLVYERIAAIRQKYLQGRKVSQINGATAKALITSRFQAAGLEVKVSGQLYRARVEVKVSDRYQIRFYLYYKKMLQDGILDDTVTAVQDLAKAIDRLGYGAIVERI